MPAPAPVVLRDGGSVFALASLTLNGAFRAFGVHVLRAGNTFDRGWKQHGVSVGKDHGGEAHLQFGAALDASRPHHSAHDALDVGSGGNHDAIVLRDRKGGLRVHRIAFLGGLGGDALGERQRNLGAGRNVVFVRRIDVRLLLLRNGIARTTVRLVLRERDRRQGSAAIANNNAVYRMVLRESGDRQLYSLKRGMRNKVACEIVWRIDRRYIRGSSHCPISGCTSR